ncbi:MAG: aminotransferase class III-fold pyridoxal phosphate-dependent enzyme [bacterium]|nr:aminotransferase class III-fold pyridoxal phosphate-dependent enzyme [bacterium]
MDEHVLPTYRRADPVFVGGTGARLTADDGREWLDFLSGIGVTALGHAHPRLVAALREQCSALTHVSNLFRHPFTDELAQRLASHTCMHAAFFSNSGAEAIEAALKIARKVQKARGKGARTAFVALEGGFHGRTFGALSVTANAAYRTPFAPTLETTFVRAGDVRALERALANSPAALVLEPLQGEGGLNRLGVDYLRAARELCDATGTVLVHDEIQCGAGRTGRFLCAQWAEVVPDVVTLAKPLAAGLPIGATLVREELADILAPGDHGSTFGGGPLVSRAALVFLDELDAGLASAVTERGQQLERGLDELAGRHDAITERRGMGLMQGLCVPGRAADLQAALFEAGLVTCTAGGDVVRFLPPYVVTAADVDEALALLSSTLDGTLN